MTNDILVKVGADISSFSRGMSTASKELSNLGKNNQQTFDAFRKTGSNLTKWVTAPAIAATGALTGITLVKGFQRLTGIDTARAKLGALGHDAENVEEIMNNALDSVRGTSFGMDEAATAAASAVAAGIAPGKELTKYLGTMGDAAAIAGTDFNEMASIFNKVETAQRAYTGDLNMLADRGIPIYQWLADEAGTSAEAIRDMASKGEVSSEMFRNAIEKNIGGAAKEIGEKSFMAALKNIGADIGRIGANFLDAGGEGEGFFSRLKPLLTEFRGFLQSLEKPAAELGKKFGDAFIKVIEVIKAVVNWFMRLSPTMKKIVAGFTAFAAIAAVAAGPLLLLIGFIPQIIAGFKTVITVIKASAVIFKGLGTAISLLTSPIGLVIIAVVALAILIYKYWDEIKEYTLIAWEAIIDFFVGLWEDIKELFNAAVDFVVTYVSTEWERIKTLTSEKWDAIKAFFTSIWDGIKNVFNTVISTIVDFVKQRWENIKTNTQTAFNKAKTLITNIWNGIKTFFTTILTNIWTTVKNKFNDVVKSVREKMNDAKQKVEDGWNKAQEFLEKIDLVQIGKDIIQGLITGIGSMGTAVWNAAKGIASKVKDSITGFFQVKSPSRVLMRIGVNLSEGLAQGIEKSTKLVARATDIMTQAAIPDEQNIDLSYATPSGIRSSLSSAVSGTVDVNARDDRLIGALASIERRLGDLEVVMDGEQVGRIVRPHVNAGNALDANVRRYF